ncbi:efflux transporter outer membrane subunit [Sphingobacterium sp. CZ-2]|uniref:efflux transporter outer membrane subunit n=1 Tax=Sphingobacterium sp. CZ-2 TaxID=2557994 RepID=UPI00106FD9FD|nr:efflux transporter outer membrane subunit [Sphingobacterium sp. CZ-2]QBR12889.1 efflux transporter outer membrane subunit [Sphingobacterium sp. CZ-2]
MKILSIHRIGLGFIGLCLLIAQGCKVGEKYTQPTLHLPDQFRGDTLSYFADTSSISNISWKDFFHDPTLKELIDSALVNNYDMKTALLNIEIASKQLRQNKYNYLPEVDATIGSMNKQWRSKDFGSGPSSKWYEKHGTKASENMFTYLSQFGSEIGFSWEIDIWGKISNAKDQLNAEFMNSQEVRNAIQTNLIANVAKGYFNLLMLDAKIEVAKRNVTLNDSTKKMLELQYQAGEITALGIQQTESQRLIAASLVPELEKEILIQENALQVLTGKMPDGIERGTSFEHLFAENKDISLGSPIDILRNRPDVRGAELELIASNANANIQQAMRYPSLSLGGEFGVNAMLPKNWFSIPGALLGGIGANLTAPIFKRKSLKTKWEVAKLERDKAELSLQQTVVEAVSEVSDAVITVEKQREQLEYARLRVENSQKAVQNANLLFKGGYATYLEVITAQSNALNSDLALVELRQEHLESYVNLYRSLGGGWR